VRGQGIVQFHLESRVSFDAQEVLYVPGLKKNLFSISIIEYKGHEVNLRKGKMFIRPEGAIPDTSLRIGVRDGNLYRLQSHPIHTLMHISITNFYHYRGRWSLGFQNSARIISGCAEAVLLARMSRHIFLAVRVDPNAFWI